MLLDFIKLLKNEIPEFRISLIDVGAQGGIPCEWRDVVDIVELTGFEPVESEYESLVAKNPKNHYFNAALWNEKKEVDFYITPNTEYSSILKPNERMFKSIGKAKCAFPHKKTKMAVDTLDNLFSNSSRLKSDFIKLDTQGSEYEILTGGEELLKTSVLGAFIEIEFIQLCENQRVFGEVDILMRSLGFEFISFVGASHWRSEAARTYRNSNSRFLSGNVFYVKRCDQLPHGSEEKLMHDTIKICIFKMLYGFPDLAYEYLAPHMSSASNPVYTSLNEVLLEMLKENATPYFKGREHLLKILWRLIKRFDERPYLNF
jgi:FkbM family methyltransferase